MFVDHRPGEKMVVMVVIMMVVMEMEMVMMKLVKHNAFKCLSCDFRRKSGESSREAGSTCTACCCPRHPGWASHPPVHVVQNKMIPSNPPMDGQATGSSQRAVETPHGEAGRT